MNKTLLVIFVSMILISAGCNKPSAPVAPSANIPAKAPIEKQQVQTDFSKLDSTYTFSAAIPPELQIEYVTANDSINIYDPTLPGSSSLEKSVIFIRNFTANDFLTLSTVNIINRNETNINGRAAVEYEIKKKSGVANFSNQPQWRSGQHKLVDIRYAKTNPSVFFVFSYNPNFPEAQFNDFINSLVFF